MCTCFGRVILLVCDRPVRFEAICTLVWVALCLNCRLFCRIISACLVSLNEVVEIDKEHGENSVQTNSRNTSY